MESNFNTLASVMIALFAIIACENFDDILKHYGIHRLIKLEGLHDIGGTKASIVTLQVEEAIFLNQGFSLHRFQVFRFTPEIILRRFMIDTPPG